MAGDGNVPDSNHESIGDKAQSIERYNMPVLAPNSGYFSQWVLDGIVVYGLQQSDLKKVAEKMKKAGLLPQSYLCPELHRGTKVPTELKSMLERKMLHE